MENKTCGECKYFSKYENKCCLLVGRGVTYADSDGCMSFVQKLPKVITNGDVIRHGGDYELMAFKKKHKCDCCIYIRNGNCTEPVDRKDRCADGLKQWLNAPAESEGEDE